MNHEDIYQSKPMEEMMLKKIFLIGLFATSLVALLGMDSNVEAGCVVIGGKQRCCSCFPGSYECEVSANQMFGAKYCDYEADNCPSAEVAIFGIPPPAQAQLTALSDGVCGDEVLDPDCTFSGLVFCANPSQGPKKPNPNNPSEGVTEGKPYQYPTSISEFGAFKQCDGKNRCKETLFLEGDPTLGLCNNNWILLTFVPGQWEPPFNPNKYTWRRSYVNCPGNYDLYPIPGGEDDPQITCCADYQRVGEDGQLVDPSTYTGQTYCAAETDAAVMIDDCTADLTNFQYGDTAEEICVNRWAETSYPSLESQLYPLPAP